MKFFLISCIPSLQNFHFLEMNRENQVLNRINSADLWVFSSFLLSVQIQWRVTVKIRISQLRSLSLQLHTTIQPDVNQIRRIRLSLFPMGGWDIIRKIQFKSLYAEILQIINHGLEVLYAPILQHSNARDYSRASYSNIKGILSSWKLSQFHFIIKLWKTSHTPILYFTHIKLVSEVKVSKVY